MNAISKTCTNNAFNICMNTTSFASLGFDRPL